MWGEYYIDMIKTVMLDNGEIRVFTSDGKFISQGCHHLTQSGAEFYAKIIDFGAIFGDK